MSDSLKNEMSIKSITSKEVNVYNRKDGQFIDCFRSVNEAGRKLGVDVRKIFRVLSGGRKSCSGYLFSYDNLTKMDNINNIG